MIPTLEPFILRAIIAGIGIAIISGVIGCFVVWRRMAYFGDSLAHSALLGVVLGLIIGISPNLGVVIACSAFAILLLWLQQKKVLTTDTLLGILAHASLSIGMVTFSIINYPINLYSYLFGDILTVTTTELYWIYIGGTIILIMLCLNWSTLVIMTIHEDLAKAEGANTFFNHILLMMLMVIVVAVSIRTVGILIITSMLIIPAATARQLVKSPETMAITATIIGIISVITGITASLKLDTPASPSIVVAASIIFAVVLTISAAISKK